ncbi:MAG: alkaline shock response membrane anchor protein AmaP, partial [Candidatus Omnitrophota bacterium]
MRTTLSILFYTLLFALLGAVCLAFAFHLFDLKEVLPHVQFAFENLRMRIIVGLSGFLLILSSFTVAQIITGKIQREKTIAFTNPNGTVTVTLSAVEDLIKKLARQFSELKDARAYVRATKKGIDIRMRVILRAETNIPDFTARLQELISTKVQEVFGIDEPISVKLHIAKIISSE